MPKDIIFRNLAFYVILEASLYGSTGVSPVSPFKLKNLVGVGIQVLILPSSRCFGFPLKPPA
jgi:hypothetical protein